MVAKAVLVLASGDIFEGIAIGAMGSAVGEVVFNTAMTGYQEILTDPSYCSQIVTLTHPHIGNTGCNPEDNESSSVWASGLIVRDLPLMASNWRNTESLEAFLVRNNVVYNLFKPIFSFFPHNGYFYHFVFFLHPGFYYFL